MRILLTGANGYIGMRLLPQLIEQGHDIVCAVRNRNRFTSNEELKDRVEIVEIDFLKDNKAAEKIKNIDVAYYLIHSMTGSSSDFDKQEAEAAENFNKMMAETTVKQVIYLSGIINEEKLSKHLKSRKAVEEILYKGEFKLTVLRAAIIVGSGSSSFEIIRDLCEKLPVMVTPKWVKTKCQPIAIRNIIQYLTGVIGREECYNKSFDVGGPDVLTYQEMMEQYAEVRKLKLWIVGVPFLSPKLSSYWLYFVTSTSYSLARNLVDSMSVEVTTSDTRLQEILGIELIPYKEAIKMAFFKIEQNEVVSSWKDSLSSGRFKKEFNRYIQIPKYGCMQDKKSVKVEDPEAALERVWAIGGLTGWYYGNWLWKVRGYLDKLAGGVGLRRGRTHPNKIYAGDSLDFWRVLLADKEEKRLLLFAEMKVPGEAWLEFKIDENNVLHQNATFRPKGLAGRAYWYSMYPFHYFIFEGMINRIAKGNKKD
ncbi:SDR family oxidoreductase [Christiangramia sabulilitoris]|uniref:SDR family oxidoreductase n=1 Tax=Christiangramia sabulilitoris TaxID=2583991 RepID=A0A550I3U9_9FLAO|nr:SDR family oxidoreductase [Christiangramia sabulilitoris]TRO65653.1 SDR family oxidoreductase [Christiangramia sabulilitoris]